ncbi:MAG TPA: penicillin-binding protein activator LpoB [bacterium]|nr:penicillin-binding protein activator LpoB [bacterium]
MKLSVQAKLLSLMAVLALAGAWGCATRTISRIDPGAQVDLSGDWNDTDSHLVSQEMISDCLGSPWLVNYVKKTSKNPTIIAGSILNKSMEHIATDVFLMDIERAMINSGTVEVVASNVERGEVRQEKADQQVNASPETLKKMGMEEGADFMLIGQINQINDSEEGKQLKYYQVDLTLVNIETNVKAWLGQKKIKKYIGQGKFQP